MSDWFQLRPLDRQLLEAMIGEGESESLEFKTALPSERALARTIVAFANSSGGTLILGVREDGSIEGLDSGTAQQAETLLRALSRSIVPWGALVSSTEINGRHLVYVSVPPAPELGQPLTTAEGRAFVRHGGIETEVEPATISHANGEPKVTSGSSPLRGFVAMSLRDEQEPALVDYFEAMNRAATAAPCEIELTRIDLVEGDYEIPNQIMALIDSVDFLIADLTLSPANVYFELGYARGRGKTVLQTCRQGTVLEFDIRNRRTIIYRNATDLEKRLKAVFDALCARGTFD